MAASPSALANLTLDNVVDIARGSGKIEPLSSQSIGPEAMARVERSAEWVHSTMREVELGAANGREPVAYYGINTGFGDNAGRATFKRVEEAQLLSRKILLSHTIGVGDPLPEDVVRAALLIRIASLSHGYSGVRPEVINTLIEMLNRRVYPVVPAQGSLGASGDLAPLAHLVIPISEPLPREDLTQPGITGWCYLNGKVVSGAAAMAHAGIPQIRLGAKEGV